LYFIEEKIVGLIKKYNINKIACEDSFYSKNIHTTKVLAKIAGCISLVAARHEIPYEEFAPTAIKKSITKKGNATKDDMKKYIKMYFPKNQIGLHFDEHMADAAAVAIHQWTVNKEKKVLKRTK
jgi:crossover junction endodeoxyribonuclease RuvC